MDFIIMIQFCKKHSTCTKPYVINIHISRTMKHNKCATLLQLSHFLFVGSVILNLLFILILINQDFVWKPKALQYNLNTQYKNVPILDVRKRDTKSDYSRGGDVI